MERNHPLLYLYGNPNVNRDEPAKVRIIYSRERNDPGKDGTEGEWICKVVSLKPLLLCRHRLTLPSAVSIIIRPGYVASAVRPFEQVGHENSVTLSPADGL
jgi:hypothetical protein